MTKRILLALVAILSVSQGVVLYVRHKNDKARIGAFLSKHALVDEDTQAMIASLKAENDSLKGVTRAAKDLKGKLVAGVAIRIKTDTVYVPMVETITVQLPDSARSASLLDTLPNGSRIKISALAPKFPNPLSIGYELTTPELRPEVGFVKLKNGQYAAVVHWEGQEFSVESAFFETPNKAKSSIDAYGRGGVLDNGGVYFDLAAGFTMPLDNNSRLGIYKGINNAGSYTAVGVTKSFAIPSITDLF